MDFLSHIVIMEKNLTGWFIYILVINYSPATRWLCMIDKSQDMKNEKGFAWRVSLSILVGVGWIVFLIL